MIKARKHLYFGIWGIYLFLLAFCLLVSGVYQLINTIQHNIDMGVIGFHRTDYEEFAIYMYLRFAVFLSVALVRIAIAGVSASCLIFTPAAKQIKTIAYLFCLLALCTAVRGLLAGALGIMTFIDIPQAALFFVFTKQWNDYQQSIPEPAGVKKGEFFPFLQEFKKANEL